MDDKIVKSPEEIESFLRDLTEVSKKHEIWVGGCGHCQSPFLMFGKPGFDFEPMQSWGREAFANPAYAYNSDDSYEKELEIKDRK